MTSRQFGLFLIPLFPSVKKSQIPFSPCCMTSLINGNARLINTILPNLFKHSIVKYEPFALIIESDSHKISFQSSVSVQDITNLKNQFYLPSSFLFYLMFIGNNFMYIFINLPIMIQTKQCINKLHFQHCSRLHKCMH